jgi:hypothetical protein
MKAINFIILISSLIQKDSDTVKELWLDCACPEPAERSLRSNAAYSDN